MKPYPRYKDSGVEWIGEIPEGWKTNKFLRTAFYQEGPGLRNWQFKESGTRVICVTNITEEGIDFSNYTRFIDIGEYEEKYTHFTVNKGDILLSSSGASWGKIAEYISEEKIMLNTSTIRINSNKNKTLDRSFIKWLMKSEIIREQLRVLMTGSCQPNFGPSHLNQLYISYPIQKSDQKQISKYLDHKTAKIDSLIEKKKRLIELLKEERIAVINQTVTKGLDPNVPMKDSGIEWLGEIPEHWEVVPLTKYLASIVDYRGRTPKKVSDGIFLVTAKNIKNGIIDYTLSEEFVDPVDVQSLLNRGRPKVGDVLFTTEAPLGEVANIDREDIALAQRVIKFRGKQNRLNNFFLKFWMLSSIFQQNLQSFATGSTALGIKASKLNYLRLVLPPIDDQLSIVKYIERETSRIDSIISKSEKEIELLQEYRTALISEVVTGKIDVREEKI